MSHASSNQSHCRLQAVFWIVLWSFLFNIAMTLAKLLDPSVNPVTLIFARSFMGALAALPLFMKNGLVRHFQTKYLHLHVLRIVIVAIGMGCTYYAYRQLPITYAAAIGQTAPLFTTVFALFLLHEKIKWFKWIALGVGYAGVIIMIRPTNGWIDLSTAIAFAANILAGLGIVLTKKLTKTDPSETILFYATFGVLTLSGILSLWLWQTPNRLDLLKLAGMGITGVLSQYCYIRSLKCAPASFVTPFEYTRLCMTIPIGFVVFGEIPDQWTILGSLLIIVAIIFLTRLDRETQGESKGEKKLES